MNTTILQETEFGNVPIDVYTLLANDRILFLSDYIDDNIASDIVATLLLLDSDNNEEKISIFINSPGGDLRNIFMIYDVMQMIQSPIETVCIGSAMDESSLLLTAGTPGMRLATKNSIISVSQVVHDYTSYSDLTDAKSILDLSVKDNKRVMEVFAKSTGKSVKTVTADFDRRVFMNATQAVKYGIVDKVVAFNK